MNSICPSAIPGQVWVVFCVWIQWEPPIFDWEIHQLAKWSYKLHWCRLTKLTHSIKKRALIYCRNWSNLRCHWLEPLIWNFKSMLVRDSRAGSISWAPKTLIRNSWMLLDFRGLKVTISSTWMSHYLFKWNFLKRMQMRFQDPPSKSTQLQDVQAYDESPHCNQHKTERVQICNRERLEWRSPFSIN